jgi:hypothetical protein
VGRVQWRAPIENECRVYYSYGTRRLLETAESTLRWNVIMCVRARVYTTNTGVNNYSCRISSVPSQQGYALESHPFGRGALQLPHLLQ